MSRLWELLGQPGWDELLHVIDAVTAEDLAVVARAAAEAGAGSLMCGSAGLAVELPAALGLLQHKYPTEVDTGERALVVAGSLSRVSREQLATPKADSRVLFSALMTWQILESEAEKEREMRRVVAEVSNAL